MRACGRACLRACNGRGGARGSGGGARGSRGGARGSRGGVRGSWEVAGDALAGKQLDPFLVNVVQVVLRGVAGVLVLDPTE